MARQLREAEGRADAVTTSTHAAKKKAAEALWGAQEAKKKAAMA